MCANNVIYMEEPNNDPSEATLGVNDADTAQSASSFTSSLLWPGQMSGN
jgi:hypothetical protein